MNAAFTNFAPPPSFRDPATFAGAAIVLTTVALVARRLPARRAARIDPAMVRRNE